MRSPLRLIVCINERLGTGQASCVGSGNLTYIETIKARIIAEGLAVPVVERECLGKCEQGPVMRIAPGGRFFTDIDECSLDAIIDALKSAVAHSAGQGAEVEKYCVKGLVTGRVQGVGFRYFVRLQAQQAGLNGYAKNLTDGSVEFLLQGEQSAVLAVVEQVRQGPSHARVDNLEYQVCEAQPDSGFSTA